jgi:hypothetical protein
MCSTAKATDRASGYTALQLWSNAVQFLGHDLNITAPTEDKFSSIWAFRRTNPFLSRIYFLPRPKMKACDHAAEPHQFASSPDQHLP